MWRIKAPALALGIVAGLAGCDARSAPNQPASRPVVRLSTSAESVVGFALAALPQFSVQAVNIGDSEKRLAALQQGTIDVALTVADVTYLAFTGRLPHLSQPLDKIRGIALLSPGAVHLMIGPGIDPSRGFAGRRVVFGDPGGGNAALGERLIRSMGIPRSETQGVFLPRGPAVKELLRGNVGAVVVTGWPPDKSVSQALTGGAHLLDVDGPTIDHLRAYYPLLRRIVIPRDTYPGQNVPLHTVGVDLLLVCRADLDANLVYELTRAYFEDTPEKFRRKTDPQRAAAVVIPLHPGAARYYREREVSR